MDASSNNDLIKQIRRYQSNIRQVDPPDSDAPRVLHYVRKLAKLPIKIDELEKTGIGKTINSLRKCKGAIGEEATLLVAKWKSIVKKQVEEEEDLDEKYTDDSPTEYDDSPPQLKSMNGHEQKKSKHEHESKKMKHCDPERVHLITIKKRDTGDRKRKNSDESTNNEVRKEKYNKIKPKDDEEFEGKNEPSLDIVNAVRKLDTPNSDSEKNRKKDKYEDKKHKKDHEKRHHKSSKHSHKDEEPHRHRSKSSHHEKKRPDGDGESQKHKEKKSKSKSKHDSDRKEKKDRRSSKEYSGSDRDETNDVDNKTLQQCESAGDDLFGAALLSIPNTASPYKKKSISSKSSTYQDSPSTPSSRRSTAELDLLSDKKLEPLEFDDYSFTNSNDIYSPKHESLKAKAVKHNLKTEEDMFISMSTTKNQRTKVFSGNKISIAGKFPTLFELCVRVLQENFDALEFTGGVPFDVLKPILEKVTVQQLYTFENFNPYLIGETDELWQYHAKKEFRKAQRLEYETWRDLYLRCTDEREEKLQSLTENISQSIANSAPVRKTKLAFVDSIVKPPRNVARNQAKFGTGNVKTSPVIESSPTATQSVKDRLVKESMSPNAIQVPSKTSPLGKKKKAPLMQKTLQLLKGMTKR